MQLAKLGEPWKLKAISHYGDMSHGTPLADLALERLVVQVSLCNWWPI